MILAAKPQVSTKCGVEKWRAPSPSWSWATVSWSYPRDYVISSILLPLGVERDFLNRYSDADIAYSEKIGCVIWSLWSPTTTLDGFDVNVTIFFFIIGNKPTTQALDALVENHATGCSAILLGHNPRAEILLFVHSLSDSRWGNPGPQILLFMYIIIVYPIWIAAHVLTPKNAHQDRLSKTLDFEKKCRLEALKWCRLDISLRSFGKDFHTLEAQKKKKWYLSKCFEVYFRV